MFSTNSLCLSKNFCSFNAPLGWYLPGGPWSNGEKPLPTEIGCTMLATGRGGPMNCGFLTIGGGCWIGMGWALAGGYCIVAGGLTILPLGCMAGRGRGGVDMIGIFIPAWLAIMGEAVCGTGRATFGDTVAVGCGFTGWTRGGSLILIEGPATFPDIAGLGSLWKNGQWGFKHPWGWDSKKHGVSDLFFWNKKDK